MSYAAVSAPDPFIVPEIAGSEGNYVTNGKTVRGQSLVPGQKTGTLLVAGQSNTCNAFATNYTPTNASVIDNMNIYNGCIYNCADPQLGCSSGGTLGSPQGGNFVGRLADKLVTAGTFQRVIVTPTGVFGTTANQWQSSLYKRIIVALGRLAAKGMTPDAILWGQGESEVGTPQATYQSQMGTIISATRAAGFTGPWFIAKQTMLSNVVNPTIQAAQLALVDHANGIWAGPDADSLTGPTNRVDGTHFTDTGSDNYATLWKSALAAYGAPFV